MLISLRQILKEITDLEKLLKRNDNREALKKLQAIKTRVKHAIVEEMKK